MKLSLITEAGYGRRLIGSYHGDQVTDPRPDVLILGRYTNHKRTPLLAGININYLTDEQIERLRSNIRSILGDRNLRRRVRMIRNMMPDVFSQAYRTYDANDMAILKKDTFKFGAPVGKLIGKAAEKSKKPFPTDAEMDMGGGMDVEPTEPAAPVKTPEPENKFTAPPKLSDRIKARNDRVRGEPAPDEKQAVDKLAKTLGDVPASDLKNMLGQKTDKTDKVDKKPSKPGLNKPKPGLNKPKPETKLDKPSLGDGSELNGEDELGFEPGLEEQDSGP